MTKNTIMVSAVVLAIAACIACALMATEHNTGGERRDIEALLDKINFSGGLLAEWIVALACGAEFSDAQIEHFIWLMAGQVETARYSYVRIDRIEKRLDKLEEN